MPKQNLKREAVFIRDIDCIPRNILPIESFDKFQKMLKNEFRSTIPKLVAVQPPYIATTTNEALISFVKDSINIQSTTSSTKNKKLKMKKKVVHGTDLTITPWIVPFVTTNAVLTKNHFRPPSTLDQTFMPPTPP